MTKRKLRSRVKRKLRDWKTNCWIPVVEQRPGSAMASKFSGIPVLKRGEDWPTCGQCGQPMPLFVQLNIDQLPPAAKPRKTDQGMVQFFLCTNEKCDTTHYAKKPAFLARLLTGEQLAQAASTRRRPAARIGPEKVIVSWRRRHDYSLCEAYLKLTEKELAAFRSSWYRTDGFPIWGDKLLGFANWLQDPDYPRCPICSKEMDCSFFQIISKCNLPYMFGDLGNGHILVCAEHPEQLDFRWDCY
jgi:hypothetical protein